MKHFITFLCCTLLFLIACTPEKAQKTTRKEAPTYSILEIIKGYWAVTDLKIAGISKKVEEKRGYFYSFNDNGTFETGSQKSTLTGKFFIEKDTIWMVSDIAELEPQPMSVVRYNKDTLIVGGIHEKTQQPLEMTMVNLERDKLPKN